MATLDELTQRVEVATVQLETDVTDITQFTTNLETAVTDAQTSADAAAASAAEAANKVPEAPVDGTTYARKDAAWVPVEGGGGEGTVTSVNGKLPDGTGAVTLVAADVGALPTTYAPTWASITGRPSQFPSSWTLVADKPTTFAPSAHTHDAGDVTSGTFSVLRIPNLPANKITTASGPLDVALIPVIPASKISGQAAATADQYLAGDGTWKTPAGGGSAGGFAFTEGGLTISGVPITAWPNTNPNKPADLTNWGHTSGVTQGQFFTSAVGIALLPDGDYVPGANSILTGQAIQGQLGVLRVRSINADGTNKRAWFYPQPLGSDTRAVFYVYSNGKQNWIPCGLASGAPN